MKTLLRFIAVSLLAVALTVGFVAYRIATPDRVVQKAFDKLWDLDFEGAFAHTVIAPERQPDFYAIVATAKSYRSAFQTPEREALYRKALSKIEVAITTDWDGFSGNEVELRSRCHVILTTPNLDQSHALTRAMDHYHQSVEFREALGLRHTPTPQDLAGDPNLMMKALDLCTAKFIEWIESTPTQYEANRVSCPLIWSWRAMDWRIDLFGN